MSYQSRHHANLKLWPRWLYCPICGGISAIVDTGATGVKYRCSLCTVEYRLPAAQAKKRKVSKAIEKTRKRLEEVYA